MTDTNVMAAEKNAILATIDPQNIQNTAVLSDVIDMSLWNQVQGIALLGDMSAHVVNFAAYDCDAAGTIGEVIKAATELAASASENDNVQIVINVRAEDMLGQTTNRRYMRFRLVSASGQTGYMAAVALGVDPRYGPANQRQLASVVETVT
jgi:hypothetical protein